MPAHTQPHPHAQSHPHNHSHSHSHTQPFPHSHLSHSSPPHHYQSTVESDPYHHTAPASLSSPSALSSSSPSHAHSLSHSHSANLYSQAASASMPSDSSSLSSSSASSPSHHQWSSSGKLKAAARSIFERAYGLNGRQREDHSALCDEVMRLTACSAKSFEELVYGHSYESELGELRKLVSDYRPKEAKRKERGGGRAASAAATGKKRGDKSSDEMASIGAMSPVARQSSAAAMPARSLLMPLYSQYPAATTPVSASRYETAYGGNNVSVPPRRKSLDANMLYGPQPGSHAHMSHHTHSSSAFVSPSPSSFYASAAAAPPGYHDSESGSSYPLSSSLTPSHIGMRHRPNFASAAAAAAAAADSVVAYVASTPTSAVMNGGWSGGLHSPKTQQQESSASAFSFAPPPAATTPSLAAVSIGPSSNVNTAASSLVVQPSSSPPSSRASLLHSPSQSIPVAVGTTLAPVTLASIKTSPPQLSSKLSTVIALTTLPPPSFGSSAASSSAVTPRPGSHASSDPPSRSSSRSNTPQPASPALAPPRPTILIPTSPLTTDAADDGGINVTGGSDVVKGSREADDNEDEERTDSGRRVQEEKAERKRRKKERRDERRGSVQAKQQHHEDVEKMEAEKGVSEHADRTTRGEMSWRRQVDANKDENKENPIDNSAKPNIPKNSVVNMAVAPSDASFTAVPHSAVAERVLPFTDVTPPPTIDFPPYIATPVAAATLTSLVRRVAASCALFTLVRLYVSYVSPAATSIDHNTALLLFLTSIVAAFFLLSTHMSSLSVKPTSSASTASASSNLSCELSRYVQAWDLIALDDPQQLLAAYSMAQQMLLSLLHALQPVSASSSPPPQLSPASLVSHAQSLLSFLDVAHQHLYSDSGYTLLLDRLLSAAAAVRHHIQLLSSSLSRRPPSRSAVSSSGLLLQLVTGCCLLAYVVLPCPVWRWSGTATVIHLLLPAALLALEVLGLFVVSEGEQRVQSSAGAGADEVEGLLELKQRMDNRMEALMAISH